MSNFDYEVHYTGSKGNCVSIYTPSFNLMIDAGKPYKYIEPHLYGIHFLIFSHRHSDHFKPAVYNKIRKNFPNIKILANETVNNLMIEKTKIPADVVFSDDFQFQIGNMKFTTIQNYHGEGEEFTDTHGVIIEDSETNEVLLYATDLSNMLDYEDYLSKNSLQIDHCLLESNYDEEVIRFYESTKAHFGYDIFSNGSYRHLSKKQHDEFIKNYCKPTATVLELHKSDTYGTFEGLLRNTNGKISKEDLILWRKNGKY